jgi:cyanophycinase
MHPVTMRRWIPFLSIVLMLPLGVTPAGQDKGQGKTASPPRLDPAGIKGALLVCGEGKVPETALERFMKLAGGDKARLVVIPPPRSVTDRAALETLNESWQRRKPESVSVWPGWSRTKADLDEGLALLRKATAVWIEGGASLQEMSLDPAVIAALQDVLERKGIVATTAGAARLTGTVVLTAEGAASKSLQGWNLLPGTAIDVSPRKSEQEDLFKTALKRSAALVGIGLEAETAWLVEGRTTRVLGTGQASAFLADAPPRAARTISWKATSEVTAVGDFTALRRAALARSEAPFPPKEAAVPEVPSGTLVIVGGGGVPPELTRRFIDLAGGNDAPIVILPTSQPDPIPPKEGDFLRKAGATNVKFLPGRELAIVESAEYLDALKKAKGVWFGGGRQWRFIDAYAGTKAEPLLHDVLRRGGVIGGSSAGASIQAEYLCRGNPLGPKEIMSEGYERGLNFLPGVAIDQHFTQRKRLPDMTALMNSYPQLLGIGLDESTGIVVRGHVAEVAGKGKAHFYDRRRPVVEGQPDYEAISDGGRYDLKERKVLAAEKK